MMDKSVSKLFLIITALTCGTLIMVIEVLGSRVIGPFFGVSLFVWTSLIAVTMIALAAGYMIGGILSDRAKSPDILYFLIGIAGLLTLLIPYAKIPVLKLCLGFGLRGGAFAGSMALFAPSLTLLGCVSPFVIKLAAREVSNVGRTVGSFYALSTIGSVVGTVLTGFVLVAYMGVNNIFFLVGFLLVGLAVSYFVFFREKIVAAVLLLPILILPFVAPTSVDSKIMENGTKVTVIDRTDSSYGNIKVLDYDNGNMVIREMVIDGLTQGGVDIKNGLSTFAYNYPLQFVPVALNPKGRRCLVIGLGAGVIPRWYMARGIKTDVVDIDPAVVEMASKYFGYPAGEQVVIEDARYFLGKGEEKYDYIILDVFNGDVTPSHILSKEAFTLIKDRLNDNGVFAMNLVGSLRENSVMTTSVIKTLDSVFGKTLVKPLFNTQKGADFGNIAVFAYAAELQEPKQIRVISRQIHPIIRQIVLFAMQGNYSLQEHPEAIILTDEYNPMDFYDLELKEKIRENILEGNDWDILLS
jgi:spermidine synthase